LSELSVLGGIGAAETCEIHGANGRTIDRCAQKKLRRAALDNRRAFTAFTYIQVREGERRTMAEMMTRDYNAACSRITRHLRNAATYEPRVNADGYTRDGMRQVVTTESLDRYCKANKIRGDERAALEQAFVTLAGRQSRGEDVTAVDVSKLGSLTKQLKGFAKTHNKTPLSRLDDGEQRKMRKTGKAIVAGTEAILARDMGDLQKEKAFSKKVDKVLEHLLVKANVGNPYLHFYELVNYSRHSNISDQMQDALWKSFRYVGRTMTYGETNSHQICIDQRQEAHRILMKLFAGNSATKKAIDRLD
jgi:hypothetical protein